MSKSYWENEVPVIVETPRNIVRYYGTAEKLNIARHMWTDSDGVERPGKSLVLDLAALLECDSITIATARSIFARVIETLDQRLSVLDGGSHV